MLASVPRKAPPVAEEQHPGTAQISVSESATESAVAPAATTPPDATELESADSVKQQPSVHEALTRAVEIPDSGERATEAVFVTEISKEQAFAVRDFPVYIHASVTVHEQHPDGATVHTIAIEEWCTHGQIGNTIDLKIAYPGNGAPEAVTVIQVPAEVPAGCRNLFL